MAVRRNLVVGLGKTGVSVVQWLVARGESVVVNDSRKTPPGIDQIIELGRTVSMSFGGFDARLLDGVDRVVVSPGVSLREEIIQEARRRELPVIGDIQLFADVSSAPIVAVTGTNGKSTVTTLIAAMLSGAGYIVHAGGNLGEPALNLLQRPTPDYYVLELSSYQLESTSHLPLSVAVILNVTPDHMDRYADMAEYASAKARIFSHAAVAVANADDRTVAEMPVGNARRVTFSSYADGADYAIAEDSITVRGQKVLAVSDIGIPGKHNALNALAAVAVCDSLGLSFESMRKSLREFRGLPHRMQVVAEHKGIRFVDDSKGTNVGATVAALEGLTEQVVLIAGGDGKNQDFSPLRSAVAGRVRQAVLIGRDRAAVAAAMDGACPVALAADMTEAVALAARQAKAGDIVLLSPACASLDMFKDYADRGNAFAAAAKGLTA
jgi:UDP-N-acetylmuramoylalanine--D-glutamate ligase